MKSIVFATHNPNKKKEVAQMLEGIYEVKDLNDLGLTDEIPEDADTLEGNAAIKARYLYDRFNVNCFADDTGLEVSALGGAPGVHTARFAGESKDADANMNKLLKALEAEENRLAQFRTAICLILDGKEYHFEGIAEGNITRQRSGAEGFGYDPVFQPKGYDITFAEMAAEEKNRISHRGRAIAALMEFLHAQS